MVFLAEHAEECPISGPRIASAVGIPRKYLSAILADLTRAGLLDGMRGKRGGFRLARQASQICLSEVIAPFEPADAARRPCPFGNAFCSDEHPCAAHDQWKEVNAVAARFLGNTTLESVTLKESERRARNGRTRSAS
jgi:Rrf2 family protein